MHLQAVNSIALASAYVPSKRFAIFFEKILPAEVNFSFARASRLAQLGKNKLGHLEGSSLAARRLLSVGCRDDLELVMLRRIFPTFRVIGLDISAPSEDIVAGDMHSMPFENGQFSVVFSSHSLEHSYQPEKAMSEMVRVCSRPGLLVIEVPISDPSGTTPTKLDKGADRWDFHNDKTIFSLLPPYAKPKLIVTEITSNIDAIRCIILLEV